MKCSFLITLVLALSSTNAFAGEGSWKELNREDEVAVTPFGIKHLLDNYQHRGLFDNLRNRTISTILVGESPAVLGKMTLTTIFYEWEGKTTCQPNDPRLKTQTYGYSACYAGTDRCEISMAGLLATDPCLHKK